MKKNLRENLLIKRDRISPGAKKKKETAVRKKLYSSVDFRRAAAILFYASFRSEVDTLKCIKHALKINKEVILPKVEKHKRELRLFSINSLDDLRSGYMAIPEPKTGKNRERKLSDIDVVIVPGAGFDPTGNRLGYGAGYYDKLMSGKKCRAVKVALAFEEQIVRKLPAEPHDVKMDKIITEKRVIDCRKTRVKGQGSGVKGL